MIILAPARPAFSESFSVEAVEVDDTRNGTVVLTQTLLRDSVEHRSFMSANGSLVHGGQEQVMRCDLHPTGWLIVAGGTDASVRTCPTLAGEEELKGIWTF